MQANKDKKDNASATQSTSKKDKVIARRDYYIEQINELNEQLSVDNLSLLECEEYFKTLEQIAVRFDSACVAMYSEFESLPELDDFGKKNGVISRRIIKMKADLRVRINTHNASTGPQAIPSASTSSATIQSGIQSVQPTKVDVKKPEIEYKGFKFTGDVGEWRTFSKDFLKATDDNGNASNEDKLKALTQACTGMPKSVVNTCGGSFEKSWEALQKVYGSNYKQCRAAMNKLNAIKPCSDVTYGELSQLLLDASEIANWFNELNLLDKFDYALALVIISKLPISTNRAWEREQAALEQSIGDTATNDTSHLPGWETVKSFLRSEVMFLAAEGTNSPANLNMRRTFADTVRQSTPQSVATQNPTSSGNQALKDVKQSQPIWLQCTCCDGIHPRFGCDVYNGWALDRKECHVSDENLCVRCLRPKHVDEKCNRHCPKCGAGIYHNSTLCPRQQKPKPPRSTSQASGNQG